MKFSNRIEYPIRENELSVIISEIGYNNIVNLVESNPTKCGIVYNEELFSSLWKKENLLYFPDPKGLKRARSIIVKYYKEKNIDIDEEQIVITSGTSEAYSFIFKILCNPDENILIPSPGYPLFDYLSKFELIRTKTYRLEYIHDKGWQIDVDSILNVIDENTKAILIINPNNPTGSYLSDREKEKIKEVAKEYNLSLIVDEVFFDFNIDSSEYKSFANERDCLTFVLSGISKILALPQMKLSWIVVCGEEKSKNEALERLELISDNYLSVSIPIQNALGDFFSYGKEIKKLILSRIKENYKIIKEILDGHFRVLTTSGGWNTIIELPKIISEDEWVKKLLVQKKCLTYPGYFFDFEKEAFITISLIIEKEKLIYGLEKIVEVFNENK